MYHITLHHIALYHTISHCITPHRTVSHHIAVYHTTSHYITPHRTVSRHIALYHATSYCITPHRTVSHHIALHTPYRTVSHHIALYHATSHCITPHRTASRHITLYHAFLPWNNPSSHTTPTPTPNRIALPKRLLWEWQHWSYHIMMSSSPAVFISLSSSPNLSRIIFSSHCGITLTCNDICYHAALRQCFLIRIRRPLHNVHEKDYFEEIVKEGSS